REVLTRALERMQDWRRRGTPYFLFLNLYDVHAPYSPSNTTPLRSWRTWRGWVENLQLPVLLPRVSTHAYLKPGFRMSARGARHPARPLSLRDRAHGPQARGVPRRSRTARSARRHAARPHERPRRGVRRARPLLPRRLRLRHPPARPAVDPPSGAAARGDGRRRQHA